VKRGWAVVAAFLHHGCAAAVPGYTANTLTAPESYACHTAANPSPVNFDAFCSEAGCWPALWLLGAQKAATTSTIDLFESCGITSQSYMTKEDAAPCPADLPCKETHAFVTPETQCAKNRTIGCDLVRNVTSSFTGAFDPSTCAERQSPFQEPHYAPYAPAEWRTAACSAGRFIDATPSSGTQKFPAELFRLMPEGMKLQARFALILREPVERMLSWYNHQVASGLIASTMTFAAYSEQQLSREFETGFYVDFIELFVAAGWARSQLLVLGFDELTDSTAAAMQRLTTHFGTPVLVDSPELPVSNSHDSAAKVVSIACTTRAQLDATYAPYNERLYARLAEDRTRGLATALETAMAPFELSLPCGQSESTMATESANGGVVSAKRARWL